MQLVRTGAEQTAVINQSNHDNDDNDDNDDDDDDDDDDDVDDDDDENTTTIKISTDFKTMI